MSAADAIPIQEAVTASEHIPSHRPDAKTRRYDRQLRLWASSGQQSLESARVLLVGADATGCQALKNLVLPGISHFTILSDKLATAQDVATNFFLLPASVGKSAGQEACRLLMELNPSVQGECKPADPETLLEQSPEFFLAFSLILVANQSPDFELALSDLLWEASDNARRTPDIPLITFRNSGFIGKVRTQWREHCIIDTHPDTLHTLRIDTPFPALLEYASGLDFDQMDSMEHGHVPYVVLLIRAAKEYKESQGKSTIASSDLDALRRKLSQERRSPDEDNYDEAISQAYKVASESQIPSDIKALFADKACEEVTKESKNFWILVRALRDYTRTSGSGALLPISSALPDMKASTTSYVTLQNLYKQKAREDLAKYTESLSFLLSRIGLEAGAVEQVEIQAFVKNCATLTCLSGRSLRTELHADVRKAEILAELDDVEWDELQEPSFMGYYIALLAASRFRVANGYWPGSKNDAGRLNDKMDEPDEGAGAVWLLDRRAVEVEAQKVLEDSGGEGEISNFVKDCIGEVCRAGFCTLPTTAAFMGGIVAQEAIKLVTSQYVPLNNTTIIDLIKSGVRKYTL